MGRSTFLVIFIFFYSLATAQNDSLVFQKDFNSITEKTKSARQLYEAGYSLFLNGDYSEALHHLNQAVKLKPYFPDAYLARASVKEASNDKLGALVDYETVGKQDENNQEAFFKIAHLHRQLGNYDECIEKINHLIYLPSGVTNAVFYKMDQDNGGVKEVMTLQSKKSDFYNLRAQCYAGKREYADAVQNFNQAIELNDSDPDLFVNRGMVYKQWNQPVMAENDFKRALQLDPWHKAAIFNLSLKDDHSSNQLMIDSYTSALQRNDQLTEAYVNRGVLWFEEKEYKKALADFDSALKIRSTDAEVLLNRGLTYEKLGRYQMALLDFEKAISYGADASLVYGYQANALYHLKQYEKAEAFYTLAINLNGERRFYFNRGLCRVQLQQHELACQDFKVASNSGMSVADQAIKKYCAEDL